MWMPTIQRENYSQRRDGDFFSLRRRRVNLIASQCSDEEFIFQIRDSELMTRIYVEWKLKTECRKWFWWCKNKRKRDSIAGWDEAHARSHWLEISLGKLHRLSTRTLIDVVLVGFALFVHRRLFLFSFRNFISQLNCWICRINFPCSMFYLEFPSRTGFNFERTLCDQETTWFFIFILINVNSSCSSCCVLFFVWLLNKTKLPNFDHENFYRRVHVWSDPGRSQ